MDVRNVLNQTMPNDPRLLLSEPFRALHFIYGLFHPDVPALSGTALVGSLAALGFRAEASRGILLRLRRGGFLDSRRVGRSAVYTLAARSIDLIDEVARRSSEPAPAWDSTFETLLVRIPPHERAFREQLRRHASYAGFGNPAPGLLVAPYPASSRRLAPLLASGPSGATAVWGRLKVDPPDAVRVAQLAWDLGDIAAALHQATRGMDAALREGQTKHPQGSAALRLLWQAIGPFFEVLSERPLLPGVLLPPDWPLPTAREAFVQLASTLAPSARAFVEELDAAASPVSIQGSRLPGTDPPRATFMDG